MTIPTPEQPGPLPAPGPIDPPGEPGPVPTPGPIDPPPAPGPPPIDPDRPPVPLEPPPTPSPPNPDPAQPYLQSRAEHAGSDGRQLSAPACQSADRPGAQLSGLTERGDFPAN